MSDDDGGPERGDREPTENARSDAAPADTDREPVRNARGDAAPADTDREPVRNARSDAAPADTDRDPGGDRTAGGIERILTWSLTVALVLAVVGVAVVALVPQEPGDPSTEFYLLGPGGNASGYPTDMSPGGSGTVVVGVANHEGAPTDYRVVVTWNGSESQRYELSLADGETRERRLTLTAPAEPGLYRVRFLLYKRNGSGRVYESLWLWISVGEEDSVTTTPASDPRPPAAGGGPPV